MTQIAVFASGTGSNFEALVEASLHQHLSANIALLVCDKPQAKVIEKAHRYTIETLVITPQSYPSKKAFESVILTSLKEKNITLIVLAGYMRLIGPVLLTHYPNRIINIHPSLLPAFKGLDAVGQALKAGVKVTGVTIHFVDEGMDTGRIIAQQAIPILKDDTREIIEHKIHEIEHRIYPKTIEQLIKESL
jgi:phosphoribosylglycinamide formyltransferase-1